MSASTELARTVRVQVERQLPFGILVRGSDGSTGIIREREIAWNARERRDWRERFRVGQALLVVTLGEGVDHRQEFSLRLAENDPWIDIASHHPLGQLIDGTVTGVQPYGVFVEIEPGLIGLLHRSRLPVWAQQIDLKTLFWVGDHVKVVIERLDPNQRQIGLSMARAWSQRWRAADQSSLTEHDRLHEHSGESHTARELDDASLDATPSWRIVVIAADPEQRQTLATWLIQDGYQVLPAACASDALAAIEHLSPDLLLVNWDTIGAGDLEALQSMQQRWPSMRCAAMMDWAQAHQHLGAIDELRTIGFHIMLKPLQRLDVAQLLTERFSAGASDDSLNLADNAPSTAHDQLSDLLTEVHILVDASKAVLFVLDPAQRRVRVLSEAGPTPLNDEASNDLIYSPVRDVAEDRIVCRIDDVQTVEARARYLKPLLPFRSCLGVRLSTSLTEQYALFLFSPQPHAFSDMHERIARMTAIALGAVLEHDLFGQRAVALQHQALLGQLNRALVHEINHQLTPVNFLLNEVHKQVKQLDQAPSEAALPQGEVLAMMRQDVADMTRNIETMNEMVRMFGRVALQTREQLADVATLVTEVIELVRDTADRSHVQLAAHTTDNLPLACIEPVQLQQILLNIVLNAIQQIELLRPSQGGRVCVTVSLVERALSPVIRVTVEDDGPGIHRQLWEQVFDLGFTTRSEGGSGLGLYITRSLAEAAGSRVCIESSGILWGTCVALELPV